MDSFQIHRDAVKSFNKKALLISEKVSFVPNKADSSPVGESDNIGPHDKHRSFTSDFHVKGVFTQTDILGVNAAGQVDAEGNWISQEWSDESGRFCISEEAYKIVRDLARQLLKIKDIRSSISRPTVEGIICQWVRQHYPKKIKLCFVDFFQAEAGKCVRKHQVWAPIRYLCIERPFRLGHVDFVPISRTILNEWQSQSVKIAPEQEDKIKEYFENKIRPTQGYTAAVMEVVAEQQKAHDILLDEANKSLALARVFTHSSILPSKTSPCVLWGTGHIDMSLVFLVEDGKFGGSRQAILSPDSRAVFLNTQHIDYSFKIGLQRLHDILIANKRSELDEAVLEAVLLYSRCTVAKEPTDKLVYILVGLESILLRDPNEPVTQSLSERIAFLVARDLEKRKQVVQAIKKAYKLRSDFLHHGASFESLEILRQLMEIAWNAVRGLIGSTCELKTRKELLDYLDDQRLS